MADRFWTFTGKWKKMAIWRLIFAFRLRYKNTKKYPHDGMGTFVMRKIQNLCHSVYSLADTGNLVGNVVLVVNTLAACHLDYLGSSGKLCLRGSLIAGLNSSENLLHRGLNAGSDCLVSLGSCAGYQNSLLCGFNVSQVVHLQFVYNK